MSLPTVLILDAHADAAIACLQSLGRAGYPVWIAGARDAETAFASKYPARRLSYPNPQKDEAGFLAWYEAIKAEGGVDYVLPVTDATIHPLQGIKDKPAKPRIILPPEGGHAIAFNKEKTLEAAKSVDVPVPESHLVEPGDDWRKQDFGAFPRYIKPLQSKVWKDGKGHSLVPELVEGEDAFQAQMQHFLALGAVQVQSYVGGRGVGVEVLCDHGEVVLHFAHQRLHEYPLTGGRSTYRKAVRPSKAMLEASKRLMAAIQWHGVAMVEYKQDGERFALMEINGRFWGSLPLAIGAGVDFPAALLALIDRGERPIQPDYRAGYRMRNLGFDLVWMRDNWRADGNDPRLMTEPRVVSLINWGRCLIFREGWDHFSWRDPGPGFTQLRQIFRDTLGKVLSRVGQRLLAPLRVRKSLQRVDWTPVAHILVLCYGNIYRSPFVEHELRRQLPEAVSIRSAGFHEREGRSSKPDYVELVQWETGVDLSAHRSRRITDDDVAWADLIIVMDERNAADLKRFDRRTRDKMVWLGAFAPGGLVVPDPYGHDEAFARVVVGRMRSACESLAARVKHGVSD